MEPAGRIPDRFANLYRSLVMLRRIVPALVLVCCTFAFAYSDTITGVRITKVEGNKVTWGKGMFDKDLKKFVIDEKTITTSTVAADAVIETAATKGGKKGQAKDAAPIEGGLKADVFSKASEKNVNVTITTTEEGGKGNITKISVGGGKGGGKKGAGA